MLSAISSYFPFHYPFSFPVQKQKSPFEGINSPKDLIQFLKDKEIDEWVSWKNEIKGFIQKHSKDYEALDQFLASITATGLEKDPQKLSALIVDLLSLDLINEVIKFKQKSGGNSFSNIYDLAFENAKFCPDVKNQTLNAHLSSEWKRYRPLVIYFIPNLINLFFGAFNFLDLRKKYTTLWEKHLLLDIIYKFLVIPYVIFKLVENFIDVTAKVYLVTAAIIVATGLLVSIYQRWLRPVPDEIVNCKNLDKLMERGVIEPKVGETKELSQLIELLEEDKNVLLVGNTGEGKTSLVHHLVSLKHQKKLPEKLQNLSMFEVNCRGMSSVNFSYAELTAQIKEQCNGFEGQILLFFDDFGVIAKDVKAFETFKTEFLKEKPHTRIVAAITIKNYQEVLEHDNDGSFEQIVDLVPFYSTDKQIELILQNIKERNACNIPVMYEAIQATVKLSSKEDYLPDTGRPARAVKIFTRAIGRCRTSFLSNYVSDELRKARIEFECLEKQLKGMVSVSTELKTKFKNKEKEIKGLEDKVGKLKKQAQKIKTYLERESKINEKFGALSHQLTKAKGSKPINNKSEKIRKDSITPQTQALYLWLNFYARTEMRSIIQKEIDKTQVDLPVQVDEKLIHQVYDELKQIKKKIGIKPKAGEVKKIDLTMEDAFDDEMPND